MGARNRGGIGLSYRPARLQRPAEFIPWNQFRGPINIWKYGLWHGVVSPLRNVCTRDTYYKTGDGDTWSKMCAVREITVCVGLTKAAKAGKNLLYRHDELSEPTKEGPLSFVLHKLPFAAVSTVMQGATPLWSLWNVQQVCLNSSVSDSYLENTKWTTGIQMMNIFDAGVGERERAGART